MTCNGVQLSALEYYKQQAAQAPPTTADSTAADITAVDAQ
jgi:hypothetical protein